MFCGGFGGAGFMNNGWFLLMMSIRIFAFIALIVLGIKLFNKHTDNSRNALKILDEKFANGEISEDDYIARKNILLQKR
ncbi:SHOCT domain-containing protein [Romboutsia sp.]|uniref:SHOCT domain-containing protein n=1 Tax=Romboutsia sp. TaxID=1965302 RepID=UPI002CD2B63E|nr:SHOCT domain-containing protein [Romboutsia sp.]HSQ87803.1 SHOCT domain-containing protein [Romboutsia sp.]